MKKSTPIIVQVAVWVSLWVMFVFTGDVNRKPPNYLVIDTLKVLLFALFFNTVYLAILPLYFERGRKRAFYVLAVLGYMFFVALSIFIDYLGLPPEFWVVRKKVHFVIIPPFFLGVMLFGVAATLRGFSAFEGKKRDEEEANRRRLEAELALLKSQINPHFLLNTLNNLYGISITEPEKTPDALLKLSDMVRYILYECTQPKVPLARDLEFVANYVDLQRLRLPPNATLTVTLPPYDDEAQIEPMMLIPFIENAFKHGLTTQQPCSIDLAVTVHGPQLALYVQNQAFAQPNKRDVSGIGIANTLQRLEHSYPGKHSLDMGLRGQEHYVHLSLDLS